MNIPADPANKSVLKRKEGRGMTGGDR